MDIKPAAQILGYIEGRLLWYKRNHPDLKEVIAELEETLNYIRRA